MNPKTLLLREPPIHTPETFEAFGRSLIERPDDRAAHLIMNLAALLTGRELHDRVVSDDDYAASVAYALHVARDQLRRHRAGMRYTASVVERLERVLAARADLGALLAQGRSLAERIRPLG